MHKNDIFEDVLHVKPYLDNISKYNLTLFYKNICLNNNFL